MFRILFDEAPECAFAVISKRSVSSQLGPPEIRAEGTLYADEISRSMVTPRTSTRPFTRNARSSLVVELTCTSAASNICFAGWQTAAKAAASKQLRVRNPCLIWVLPAQSILQIVYV